MTEVFKAPPKVRRGLLVIAVLLGMFCASMEAMVTATLMPSILAAMEGFDLYPWVGAAYLLASVTSGPLFGTMADVYGYRRIYSLALAFFLLGSLLCGMAESMSQLIGARVVQGIGSAGLITLSIVLFGVVFPPERRAKMQAMNAGTWALSSIVGPFVGSLCVEYLSWRWAFFINIPPALCILVAVTQFGQLRARTGKNRKLDWMGAALFSTATTSFVAMLLRVGQLQFGVLELLLGVCGLLFGILFIKHLASAENPIVPIGLIRRRVSRLAICQTTLMGALLFALINFLPLFVQGVMGLSPRAAGWIITSVAIGMFVGAATAGMTLNRLGFRTLGAIGGALVVLGYSMLWLSLYSATVWQLVVSNLVVGMGLAIFSNTLIVAMQAIATADTMGSASSLMQFFRMFGGTLGIALLGGVQLGAFRRNVEEYSLQLPAAAQEILASPEKIFDPAERLAIGQDALSMLSSSLLASLQDVFLFCFVAGVVIWWLGSRMPRLNPKQLAEELTVSF